MSNLLDLFNTSLMDADEEKILAKQMAFMELIKDVKIRPDDISVTVEKSDSYKWKKPKGIGWTKTIDPKTAVKNVTKRLHVVMSDATSDIYFYK